MVEDALYIEKDKEAGEGMDYYSLRKEGVRFLQEMCGEIWTDYNEHDPGVTMLEQFCYALTSLSYLTETPLRDLLIDKNKGRIDGERQALFIPRDIYPCNPWTATDYRKLVLDRIAGVGNAWFLPFEPPESGSWVNGLYDVLLYVPEPADQAAVKQEVRKIYAAHRSLCEDIHRVRILTHKPVQLYAEVAFNDESSPEVLLAQVLFAVNQYLAPELRRDTLEDMLARGLAAAELFEGPLLMNGFIPEKELQPKAAVLYINQVERAILGIKGIENIRKVFLKSGDEEFHQQVMVPEDVIRVLDTRPVAGKGFTVRFYKKGIEYVPDPVRVQKELLKLYQVLRLRYKLDGSYEKFFSFPSGRYKPVEDYYSIQNQFPIVYGINRYGLLKTDKPERKARARQLKGYLLLFEQLMADFQAQLAHVRDLFCIDPGVRHTYFYQSLEKIVPNIRPILKGGEGVALEEGGPTAAQEDCDGYERGLRRLIDRMDPYWDRRNRFLDFLLALYGEKISEYSLSPYGDCYREQAPAQRLIDAKLQFLRQLVRSTRDRGKAFDYLEGSYSVNIPGMEWKIRILLGMRVPPLLYLSEEFGAKGFKLVGSGDEKIKKLVAATQTSGAIINEQYERVELGAGGEDVAGMEEGGRQRLDRFLFYRDGLIDEELISFGPDADNYRIGFDKARDNWEVVFCPGPTAQWKTLGSLDSREEAMAAVRELVGWMRGLCCSCNRLHIVEHNLLRYALRQEERSFTLPGDPCGGKEKLYSFPFSCQVSVIFSGCSRLIDNAGYREFAERTVAENTPAHILASYCWLGPWQMLLFEILFRAWKMELAAPEKNPALLAALSKDMILFLREARHKKT